MATKFILADCKDKAAALAALQSGAITPAEYLAWDKAQGKSATKTRNPPAIGLADFLVADESLVLTIRRVGAPAGENLGVFYAKPRQFASGSYGMQWMGKVECPMGGANVKLQANCNFVVCGSAPAKDAE